MSFYHLNMRHHRVRRLALATAAAALASAASVSPALAGGCNFDQCSADPDAPVNTTPPTITLPLGFVAEKETAQTTLGVWTNNPNPGSYRFQWWRCDKDGARCKVILGATAPYYTFQFMDEGSTIRSQVIASNSAGSTASLSSQTGVIPINQFV
jgi:hypothetical protein